ncbi:MAG TPA: cobyrinate a,c-diamide synthase [bacterium]|nr:cobyrinate a,c-diamide synthase [bacterium]
MVAAAHTGAGKTTVTIGLIAALRRRGYDVRPFKVGPDYIDPGFLSRAAGHAARNLDGWLLDAATLRWLFDRHAGRAAVGVVEGMMGLFDGLTGTDDTGSTAHVARTLGLPVVVVLDASRAARSVAAVARGCQVFDRHLRIAGWVLNRVAGETHRHWVTEAVEGSTRRPVLGSLPDDPRLALPERHLGLVQAHETLSLGRLLARLGHDVEQGVDLARLLRSTRAPRGTVEMPMPPALARLLSGKAVDASTRPRQSSPAGAGTLRPSRPVVAWARDAAFTFQYADNIELLETLGARVVAWSPLADQRLPAGTAAIVLGGGYPESYAAALADNRPALRMVRAFAEQGGPIYAECGGLMYLARGIAAGGRRYRLAGIVPAWARLTGRTRVAYVRAEMLRDTILASRGTIVRGHEFHTSSLSPAPAARVAAYRVADAAAGGPAAPFRLDGYGRAGVLASYVHVNFLSDPRLAVRFVTGAGKNALIEQRRR